MLPLSGPLLYTVPGVSGVSIGAGVTLGPISFKWPSARFVTGISVCTRGGTAAELATLALSVIDEDQDALIVEGGLVGGSAPLLAFGGLPLEFWPFPFVQPIPLQRPVAAGDVWRFSLTNDGAAPVVPTLLLHFGKPVQ